MNVGSSGDGSLRIRGGGNVVVQSFAWIGTQSGASGRVEVEGVGSSWDVTSDLSVGRFGRGELEITNQATVESDSGSVGVFSGGNGSVTVSGPGSVWNNDNNLIVGSDGAGSLFISDGGRVESSTGLLGLSANGDGAVTVNGTSSSWSNGTLAIGFNNGSGTLNITGGANVSASNGFTSTIGQLGNATGVVNVDGTGSLLSITGNLHVGSFANGTLNLSNGGEASISNDLIIAAETGSQGNVNIGGGDATLNVGNLLEVGNSQNGNATLTVSSQGHINGATHTTIGQNGTLTISGGTLTTTAFTKNSSGTFLFESGTLTINGGFFDVGSTYSLNGTSGTSTLNLEGGISTIDQLTLGNTGYAVIELSNGHSLSSTEATIGPLGHFIIDGGHFSAETLNNLTGGKLTFLGGRLSINGDVYGSSEPVSIPSSGILDGSGFVEAEIYGHPGSTISVTQNSFTLGNPFSFVGFIHAGKLDVGGNIARLKSAGFAQLGSLTTMAGGSLIAENGVLLGSGDNLSGNGTVDSYIAASFGSIINANGSLILGDSSSPIGFSSEGILNVGNNSVIINDLNAADLGILTTLASGGILDIANGAVIDSGDSITGQGTIQSPNDPLKPIINNGSIVGESSIAQITLSGYVKGVGVCDNCNITGTDAPGLSTASVNRGSVSYNGKIEIEIGGTSPGNNFDQLNHVLNAGIADLGGTLEIQLIDGFTPTASDSFTIITANSIEDEFDSELLPSLSSELAWNIDYQPTSVTLTINLAGDYNNDGTVDAADYTIWRDNLGTNVRLPGDTSPGSVTNVDFNVWQSNFGNSIASLSFGQAIPEPTACLLLGLGMSALILTRHS